MAVLPVKNFIICTRSLGRVTGTERFCASTALSADQLLKFNE